MVQMNGCCYTLRTMAPTTLIIDAAATYRLVRLAQVDDFPPAARLREHLRTSDNVPDWVWDLYECPWCLSFWVGLGVALARKRLPGWSMVAAALAYSAVCGWVPQRDPKEH